MVHSIELEIAASSRKLEIWMCDVRCSVLELSKRRRGDETRLQKTFQTTYQRAHRNPTQHKWIPSMPAMDLDCHICVVNSTRFKKKETKHL